jgi:hypothetical protein
MPTARSSIMTNRRQLDQLNTPEPLILNEAMISQWLKDHRAEYNSAIQIIRACLVNSRLHRRQRKLVWYIFTRIGGY